MKKIPVLIALLAMTVAVMTAVAQPDAPAEGAVEQSVTLAGLWKQGSWAMYPLGLLNNGHNRLMEGINILFFEDFLIGETHYRSVSGVLNAYIWLNRRHRNFLKK